MTDTNWLDIDLSSSDPKSDKLQSLIEEPDRYTTGFSFWDTGDHAVARRLAMSTLFGWTPDAGRKKVCPGCFKPFYDSAMQNQNRFCTKKCRNAAHSRAWRKKLRDARTPKDAVQCAWCRGAILQRQSNHIYCSPRCRIRARDQRNRPHRLLNWGQGEILECGCGCGRSFKRSKPNQLFLNRTHAQRQHKRNWLNKRKLGKLRKKQCPVCAKAFFTISRRKKYCKVACCKQSWKDYKRKGARTGNCIVCGRQYTTHHGRRKTCSAKCIRTWVLSRRPHSPELTRDCRHCGKSFKTTTPRQWFCSTEHRYEHSLKPHPEIACLFCGKAIKAKFQRNAFCTKKHGNAYRRRSLKVGMKAYAPRVRTRAETVHEQPVSPL